MATSEPRYWFPKPYADFVQRLRVAGGFVLLAAFAYFAEPTPRSVMLGLPCSILGLVLRGWAAGHVAKDRELATSGPYAYLRNPLYIGTLVAAFGLVMAAHNAWLGILFAVVFFLVYLPAVELEEQHLRALFSAYAGYADRVNRFFPGRRYASAQQAFSTSLYLRNEEYKATLGWCIAVAWLVWKCWFARAA